MEQQYNLSVTIEDIDTLVLNYIKDSIDLYVVGENNNLVKANILYSNPERWKTIQQDGYVRDLRSNQVILPVITFKRSGIESRDSIINNDMNQNLYIPVNRTRSKKYIGQPDTPEEVWSVLYPKFVKIGYDFIIFTKTIRQNNSLVQSFMMHDKRYWGNRKAGFFTRIANVTNEVEQSNDSVRVVKSTFSISVDSFLIPETFMGKSTVIKQNTITKVDIDSENII